jgi:hypothetical protein
MFQRNILSPSSGLKCKSSKKPVEAGGKLISACHPQAVSSPHGVTTQKKTVLFIVAAVNTSDINFSFFYEHIIYPFQFPGLFLSIRLLMIFTY